LTAEILGLRPLEAFIRSYHLIPGKGGKFEVTVNGELVFSKIQLGRHAEPGEVLAAVRAVLIALYPDAERLLNAPETGD
jgi:selenoprotein W-related protein